MLARVFEFFLQRRPSSRSANIEKDLASACSKILVDTLALLLQGGVPVLCNVHIFGPELVRCAFAIANLNTHYQIHWL